MSKITPDDSTSSSAQTSQAETKTAEHVSDQRQEQSAAAPIVSARRSISSIWLLPLIALCISGWMFYQDWANRGQLVNIHFMTADGIEVGKTKIKVRNVEVGQVESVRLNYPGHGVIINARIEPESANLLYGNTKFWVVRPRIGASGISGLGTLLSGAYIEMNPGDQAKPPKLYIGLEEPPVTSASEPGLRLQLSSAEGHSLNVGDRVLFRGFPVGRIERLHFDSEAREALYGIFIQAPYDRLVNSESRFWNISGISLNLSANGVNVQTGSLDTLLSGGIAFDNLDDKSSNSDDASILKPVQAGERFKLYSDFKSVREQPFEHYIEYLLLFDQSVRGLVAGAPVEFRGVQVGTVERISFNISELKNETDPRIPVVIRLEPGRLGYPDEEGVIAQTRGQLIYWVNRGMRASLKPGNLITGSLYVGLDIYPNAPTPKVDILSQPPMIPTIYGGFAQIESKLLAVLNKVEQLKIEPVLAQAEQTFVSSQNAIAQLNSTLKQVEKLTLAPSTQAIPEDIQLTLKEIRLTAQGLSPDSRLYQEIHRTLETLQQTLGQLQPVLKTLDKKSNALVFEAPKGADIIPGGQNNKGNKE